MFALKQKRFVLKSRKSLEEETIIRMSNVKEGLKDDASLIAFRHTSHISPSNGA